VIGRDAAGASFRKPRHGLAGDRNGRHRVELKESITSRSKRPSGWPRGDPPSGFTISVLDGCPRGREQLRVAAIAHLGVDLEERDTLAGLGVTAQRADAQPTTPTSASCAARPGPQPRDPGPSGPCG